MIVLDTDHLSVLQQRSKLCARLLERISADDRELSANLRDFEQVPGLRVEDWLRD